MDFIGDIEPLTEISDSISKVKPSTNHKKKRYNWNYINDAIDELAIRVAGKGYKNIYGLPRGGLIPAVILSHKLNIPLVDKPFISAKTLVVDDLVDSGNTIRKFRKIHGNFDLATIHCKTCSTTKPTYYYEDINEDIWVVYPWE